MNKKFLYQVGNNKKTLFHLAFLELLFIYTEGDQASQTDGQTDRHGEANR